MHDYTGNEIRDALSNIGISLGDTIYCHSNIGLFGYIENYQSKRQVCEQFYKAIFDIIGPKGTLIVPTYTTHIPSNDQVFDSNNTVSKMGVFAEWIRTHNNSIRSLDPFFSVAAIGADADYRITVSPRIVFLIKLLLIM
jgi:aminoglycoside 3-N-acetyltransferase